MGRRDVGGGREAEEHGCWSIRCAPSSSDGRVEDRAQRGPWATRTVTVRSCHRIGGLHAQPCVTSVTSTTQIPPLATTSAIGQLRLARSSRREPAVRPKLGHACDRKCPGTDPGN
eukprot:4427581-Prymnesium_polylepis.1